MAWKASQTGLFLCIIHGTFSFTSAADCPPPPANMCFNNNLDSCPKLDTLKPILNTFTMNFFAAQLSGVSSTENLISFPMHLALPLGKKCRATLGKAQDEIKHAFGIDGTNTTCMDILDVILFLYRTTPHKSEVPDNRDDVLVADTSTFIDKTLKIKGGYECLWQQMFNMTYVTLDIQKNPEAARAAINSIIADKTKFFKYVVPPKGLASGTKFFALNLFYLQFTWKNQFDPSLTVKAPFHNADGSVSQVDTMQFKQKNVAYTENKKNSLVPSLPDLQVVILPNMWNTYSFIVLLPKKSKDLPVLEKALTGDVLEQLLDKASTAQVTLHMPKFNLDQLIDDAQSIPPANKLGIVTAFQKHADYSSMADRSSGGTILPSQMLQKLTLEINEKGLKAMEGTTTSVGKTRSLLMGPRVEVHVDRPFLFAIRMDESGYFTFIGRIAKL